jgi:hypothetical protein
VRLHYLQIPDLDIQRAVETAFGAVKKAGLDFPLPDIFSVSGMPAMDADMEMY